MRRRTRLLALSLPGLALGAALQAALAPIHATEPFLVAAAPPGARAKVEAAATARPTPAPTPRPTPRATAVPTVVPAPPPPPPPASTPRNRLVSADGRLDTAVGWYSDCSGGTPLTHSTAAVDTCITWVTYFVGHNPGVFTPLLSESVGSVITWWDGDGTAHRLRIVAVRDWYSANGVAPRVSGAVVAQFQTCKTVDGSQDWIYDAVPA